jgi:hypothetical protein
MSTCADCFASEQAGRDLQILVDTAFPGFSCENCSISPHSPGPVTADEKVVFLLVDPLHYDPVRKVVVPDAFQELTNRDLSTLRQSLTNKIEAHATRDELVARGAERLPPQIRAVEEVCIASVADLREQRHDNNRILGVYDTALKDKPAHASLFTVKEAFTQRALRKVVRERVHRLFTQQVISFPDFVSSLPDAPAQ